MPCPTCQADWYIILTANSTSSTCSLVLSDLQRHPRQPPASALHFLSIRVSLVLLALLARVHVGYVSTCTQGPGRTPNLESSKSGHLLPARNLIFRSPAVQSAAFPFTFLTDLYRHSVTRVGLHSGRRTQGFVTIDLRRRLAVAQSV